MKVFLDTNVMIDLIVERTPFYEQIAKIVTIAEKNKIELFTSSLSFVNTFYVANKEFEKKAVIESLKKFRVVCNVSIIDELTIDKSLLSDFEDFEDAVQYNSALFQECSLIITRDKKGFKNAKISVLSPIEFLASLKK